MWQYLDSLICILHDRFKALELVVKKVLSQTDAAEFLVAFEGIQDVIHQYAANQRFQKGPVTVSAKVSKCTWDQMNASSSSINLQPTEGLERVLTMSAMVFGCTWDQTNSSSSPEETLYAEEDKYIVSVIQPDKEEKLLKLVLTFSLSVYCCCKVYWFYLFCFSCRVFC